ncbi:hypothetical protein CBS101457_002800 [Exobasidium rhododendri]|nr:hypothetical protein CBS101457_002800 [Exobasidium rhododendri]
MTAIAGDAGLYRLDLSHTSKPVVLSTLQLPLHPSSSSSTEPSPRYEHVLPSRGINPRMDLVALLSRDVIAPSSASASMTSTSGVFAPPPPGMSAAANQARMKMMMMARARALALGKGGTLSQAAAAVEVPKVTRSASLRLSLWRMASMAGERGSRVWDVEIKTPDLFHDASDNVKELEDINVTAMTWSPEGRSIALTVQVTRRRVGETQSASNTRFNRFLMVYDLQDGKQQRIVRIPQDEAESSSAGLYGVEWCRLGSSSRLDITVSWRLRED